MKLNIDKYIAAGYSGIWISSLEPDATYLTIQKEVNILRQRAEMSLFKWTITQGWGQGNDPPLMVFDKPPASENAVCVLQYFHYFVNNPEVCQRLLDAVNRGKIQGIHWVVLAPHEKVPAELEKYFLVLEDQPPSIDELYKIAHDFNTQERLGHTPEELMAVAEAAKGLGSNEAENAFAFSIAEKRKLDVELIKQLKVSSLKKHESIEIVCPTQGFESLGGLKAIKDFCLKSLLAMTSQKKAKPRGVILLGVPGTGKSALAKALSYETKIPLLNLNLGGLYGSLVGQTESNVRRALRIADAAAPCILFIDEIEKYVAGLASSGKTDSGVTSRLIGTMLSWMNDHESEVYLIATCNDFQKLPPEFSRAERFDAIFFFDIPSPEEKEVIWDIYLNYYEIEDRNRPNDSGWTGAEIKSCCRLANLLDISLEEAAAYVTPVARYADIGELRKWATNRCLSASYPGIFVGEKPPAKLSKRKIHSTDN